MYEMLKQVKNVDFELHKNVRSLKLVIAVVEFLHLVINIFIFCYVIIWNHNTSIQLREQFLNKQSHATKDTLHQGIQKHFQVQRETFPVINNVIDWILVLNVLLTITRLTFF